MHIKQNNAREQEQRGERKGEGGRVMQDTYIILLLDLAFWPESAESQFTISCVTDLCVTEWMLGMKQSTTTGNTKLTCLWTSSETFIRFCRICLYKLHNKRTGGKK